MKKSIFKAAAAAAVFAAFGLASCYNSAPDDVPYVYVNGGQIGGGNGGSSETSSGTGGGDSSGGQQTGGSDSGQQSGGGQQQGGQSGDNSARGSYVDTSTNEALRNYLVGNWAFTQGIFSGTMSFNSDGTGHIFIQRSTVGVDIDKDFSWTVNVITGNGIQSLVYISGTDTDFDNAFDDSHSLGTTFQNQFEFCVNYDCLSIITLQRTL